MRIDLNADVGESLGAWRIGDDERLIPLLTSANVACGAHAGDPLTMERTVRIAARHDVAVGAHPGYPDLVGFGRRELDMAPDELEASIVHQVGGLLAFCRDAGVQLRHVKAHGALYNRAARDPVVAESIAKAVKRISPSLVLVGLAGSELVRAGRAAGLRVAEEAFADRAYESDGSLRSRRLPGAVLHDSDAAARQALTIVAEGSVTSHDGVRVSLRADTLCIHGDTTGAVEIAKAVRSALSAAGVEVLALEA